MTEPESPPLASLEEALAGADEAASRAAVNGGGRAAGGTTGQSDGQPRPRRHELQAHEWWVATAVGLWLGSLGVAALMAAVWAWGIADRVGTTSQAVRWSGPDFTATAGTSALVLAAVGGVVGSFVHSASLFASRVGRRTFENSYFWWYLLRPLEAALVAMVFVAALRSGFVALGASSTDTRTTVLAFLAGGLAGLFTDRVMQRLRQILGATRTDEKASEQVPPGTPATTATPATPAAAASS